MLDMPDKKEPTKKSVVISAPKFQDALIHIVGTAPYCMNKMSSDNRKKIMDKQMQGGRSKKGGMRDPKDFDKIYKGTIHVMEDGSYGIPAAGFRQGMISACRTVGFQMTRAKQCVFVVHDGVDKDDGMPLVRINGTPKRRDMAVKLADGSTDILPRAFFDSWTADVHLRWDADQFSDEDVMNLLMRMGVQVGIGAGRPDSRNSAGMGWGTFAIQEKEEAPAKRKTKK
jgi:hypothetical protein